MGQISPTNFQQAVLRFRDHVGIMNAGGRGSGKTFSLIIDLIDLCQNPGETPLVIRESWAGLQELQGKVHALCIIAFGQNVQRNKSDGTITLPNGNVITFTNIGDEASYAKLQGRTFTALYADEVGNYPPQAFKFLQLVRSNLRVAPGRRPRLHFTANPHGRAHTKVKKGWIDKAPAWYPYQDEAGDWWVHTTSDLTMNPHIDQEQYTRQLTAATSGDTALTEAWIKGSWGVLGGNMFEMWDPNIHIVVPPQTDFKYVIGADWGTASPSTALLLGMVRTPIGKFRTGDIIALDETDTAYPDDLSKGTGVSIQTWCEMLEEMTKRNGQKVVRVVTDDARGLDSETVVTEMQRCGLNAMRPNQKNRISHWALLRSMLQAAVEGDSRPAFWVTNNCPHLISTLPEAPRGTLRAEDLDPKWNEDHWLDGLAYGLRDLHGNRVISGRTIGMW
jgi:hypothetical protein